MYSLVQNSKLQTTQLAAREIVPFMVSLMLANTFCKFGSFALELVAFIPTWFVLSWVVSRLINFFLAPLESTSQN